MARFDTLLLANYGILQPTRRRDAMTILHPIASLSAEERRDLMEFAEFVISQEADDYLADALEGDDEDEGEEGVMHEEG
ncbi:MAG: hypothetical protein IAF58_20695 [Leptolyngbya sp.]|nr:hypothetical protein [Candidatus Melainabacteria bacterium]